MNSQSFGSSPGTILSAVVAMSSSPTKDAEKGAAVIADEVELARMGYKQELKFVRFSVRQCRVLTFVFRRRELSLMQVQQLLVPAGVCFHDLLFRTSVSRSPLSAS